MSQGTFLLVGGVLVLSVLTGCGDNTEKNEDLGGQVDAIKLALQTGDASYIESKEQALNLAIETLDSNAQRADALVKSIYQDDAISYSPGKSSHWVVTTDIDNNVSLLIGNKGKSLASAGQNGGRYTAFGSDIVRHHADYASAFSRLVNWLISGDATNSGGSPTIAVVEYSLINAQVAFDTYFTDVTYVQCSNSADLASCVASADLIVFGSGGNDSEAENLQLVVEALLAEGKSLLYSHTKGWSENGYSRAILSAMNMDFGPYAGNYWAVDAANWNHVDSMLAGNTLIDKLKAPLVNIRDNAFSFDYSGCTTHVGFVNCANVTDMGADFFSGAQLLKDFLNKLDRRNIRLFDIEGNLAWKYMTLYADKVRAEIQYPMDKSSSNQDEFFAALYADHGVHYHRDINGVQLDLGTFSGEATNADIPLVNTKIDVEISKDGGFTAIGLYVLPGQPFSIRRGNELVGEKLWLKINTQRTGSSRYWNRNTYNRPAFLQSVSMPLNEGETLTLTTPYGGTMQLVSKAREMDTTVTLNITNVAQHAVMSDLSKANVYMEELSNNQIDWTELKTPLIQIHSLASKMSAALNENGYNGDVVKFFDDVDNYMIKNSYNLAGFTADGLALNSGVQHFCDTYGWVCVDGDIHGKPALQHINIDKYAHCGGGCSGNPYDQSWNLNPLGWGESHEIGHNLQRGRLKIEGGRSNEVSNQIFPIYKNVTLKIDTGKSLNSTRSNYKSAFNMLKEAASDSDPKVKANELIWAPAGTYDNNGVRIAFFMQLVHLNESASFDSPWDVYTLSYLLERQFTAYIKSDDLWQSNKESLGFGTYANAPSSISGNDFMLVAHSFIAKQDLRPIWDLWGIDYSSEASNQVTAYGYSEAEKVFYYSDDTNTESNGSIVINPTSNWPL
ncbi:ImpA family metalloprotease [Vibrio nomapromontoriensis]|uniref:ImpA family metalloprotease n=1 Tax=Vibrio nomapromontoriensis TaxID=2910246 RepID=UPI003D0C8357